MLNGIDVGSNNSGVDTASINADFVVVKVTEGQTYVNPYFEAQAAGAQQSGKLLGLYHFARSNPEAEADYFLRTCGDYVGKVLLALDWEADDACALGPAVALKFLQRVYAATGVRPLIYMDLGQENGHDWSAVVRAGFGLWVAQYNLDDRVDGYKPRDLYGDLKYWSDMAIFQYASVGRLPGYGDNLDLDTFYGTREAWAAYAKPDGKPQSTLKPSTPAPPAAQPVDSWITETGTFTLGPGQAIRLRTQASDKASVIAMLVSGQEVNYDAYMYADGYVWIRQRRDGGYGYMATGTANGAHRTSSWGTFR